MLKIHFLRNILLASLAVVIMFPFYDIFVAYPKFVKALSEEVTDQSVRISGHLSSSLNLSGILMYSDITAIDAAEIEAIRQDLNIVKIKLFSANGDAIYSTDLQDMRSIHDRTVFHQTIARGTGCFVLS